MNSDWRLRRAVRTDAELIAAIFASSRRAAMPYLPVRHTDLEVLQCLLIRLLDMVAKLALDSLVWATFGYTCGDWSRGWRSRSLATGLSCISRLSRFFQTESSLP